MFIEKSENNTGNDAFTLDNAFMASCFPNGIRFASLIDQNKVRRMYKTRLGIEIPDETDLPSLLRTRGIHHKDKVYFLSEERKNALRDTVRALFNQGYHVLYYSELFRRQSALLETCHLYEETILHAILKEILPTGVCQESRILETPENSDLDEVLTAYGNEIKLSYAQIQERRPYLTLSAIKSVLSNSGKFVWTESETYAIINKIMLAEQDVRQIKTVILPQMRANGYISLHQLPIQESRGINPGISPVAIRDVMFLRHMASTCSRRGVIATPKGDAFSAYELMIKYCKTLDRAALSDLRDFQNNILTGFPDTLMIQAVCSCMVRINADTFVSDAAIKFDIMAADHAVGLFVNGRIIPITAITSFNSFPEVEGYSWNLYLAESFLRRFSREYHIMGGPARISYVGGICPASMKFDSYDDLLAAAAVQDSVPLNEESIGRYLTEKKYILRRSSKIRTVFQKAFKLSEQKGNHGVQLLL